MSRSRTGSHQSHHTTAAEKHTNMEEVQELVKYKYKDKFKYKYKVDVIDNKINQYH